MDELSLAAETAATPLTKEQKNAVKILVEASKANLEKLLKCETREELELTIDMDDANLDAAGEALMKTLGAEDDDDDDDD